MSCLNENCNPGCNCNNCCPPVTPPTPPPAPDCIGTDCVELYDGKCVEYTGPAITCFGITPNMNFNTIVNMIANTLCACTKEDKCINPMVLFFERFKFAYDTMYAQDENLNFKSLFSSYLDNGLIVKKCQYCCSDTLGYALCFNSDKADEFESYIASRNNPELTTPCTNCWENYTSCGTELLTLFDPTINGSIPEPGLTLDGSYDSIYEFGGFSNQSGLCVLVNVLKDLFTYDQITDIIYEMSVNNFVILCDINSGNIVIGNSGQVFKYLDSIVSNLI